MNSCVQGFRHKSQSPIAYCLYNPSYDHEIQQVLNRRSPLTHALQAGEIPPPTITATPRTKSENLSLNFPLVSHEVCATSTMRRSKPPPFATFYWIAATCQRFWMRACFPTPAHSIARSPESLPSSPFAHLAAILAAGGDIPSGRSRRLAPHMRCGVHICASLWIRALCDGLTRFKRCDRVPSNLTVQ